MLYIFTYFCPAEKAHKENNDLFHRFYAVNYTESLCFFFKKSWQCLATINACSNQTFSS